MPTPQWTEVGTSSANTAKTTTRAAVLNQRHYITAIDVIVRGATAANDICIELRDGSTVEWNTYIGSGKVQGERYAMVWPATDEVDGVQLSVNTAANLVVAAGGASVITEANISGYTK